MKAIRDYRFLAVVVALVTGGYACAGWAESSPSEATDNVRPAADTPEATADKDESHKEPETLDTKRDSCASGKWYASPDGRFVLVHIESSDSRHFKVLPAGEDRKDGFLYVLDRVTVTSVALPPYGRSADFLWSPDSRHLVYNDYAASNEAYCYVYEFAVKSGRLTARGTDLRKLLRKVPDVAPLFAVDHQYVAGTKWADAHTLLLGIKGHTTDDGRSCEWEYSYSVNGHFKRVKYHEERYGRDGK